MNGWPNGPVGMNLSKPPTHEWERGARSLQTDNGRRQPPASDPAEEQQDDDDDNDQAYPTTGRVAPAFAMTPSGEGSQEGKDEDDEQNGSK